MAEPSQKPRFVWWSTQESYDANIPSLLGIAEVGLAVWLYWWLIPAWFDTHWHLVASVCIAPLLLLRSKASIEEALDGFEDYLRVEEDFKLQSVHGVTIVALSCLVGFALGLWLLDAWLPGYKGWGMFWRAAIVGWFSLTITAAITVAVDKTVIKAAVAAIGAIGAVAKDKIGVVTNVATVAADAVGAVAKVKISALTKVKTPALAIAAARVISIAVTITAAIIVVVSVATNVVINVGLAGIFTLVALLVPGVSLGYLIRAFAQKTLSTLRYLQAGWRNLTGNWQCLVFAQDFRRPPELLPGQHARPEHSAFHAESYLDRLTAANSKSVDRVGGLFLALVVIPPAWFYRLSLKSTFWFYWPLVFAQQRVRGIHVSPKTLVAEHSSTLAGRPLALFALALAVSPFSGVWQSLGNFTRLAGVTAEHLNLVALLGEKALLVWPAALVSLLLYASANLLGPRADNGELTEGQLRWLKALIGLRWTLVWTALLTGLLLFAAESAPDRVPVLVTHVAQWVQTHYLALFGVGSTP